MRKLVIKRVILVIIFMISFFVFIPLQKVTAEDDRDLSLSTSWRGEDMTFDVLSDVDYVSPYVPFETIIDHPELVDINQIYVIEKATDLYHYSRLAMSSDALLYLSLHLVLGNDINYYDAVLENMNYRFHPIGFNEPFMGTFDGQGFEITNLYFQTILDEETYDLNYQGLRYMSMFSKIGETGIIQNFGLINPILIQPIEWKIMQFASYVAGENAGLVSHIYVIDQRLEASGMHVDGAFHLSGLVSVNTGVMEDLFIASPYIRSRAVSHALSVSPIVYQDLGTSEHMYYDETIYSDLYTDLFNQGLPTEDFQDDTLFSENWYFNDAYQALATTQEEMNQVLGDDIYPSLHGLEVNAQELVLNDAVDVLIMQELLIRHGFFRKATYSIQSDIDMASIARDAYHAQNVSFDGVLTSDLVFNQALYTHQELDGGAYAAPTIFNMSLTKPTQQYDYATYGMFSVLFGHVENLNFRSLTLTMDTIDQSFDTIKAGMLAGHMIGGSINNVHMEGQIIISQSSATVNHMMLGGLVGESSGEINQVSMTGQMNGFTQLATSTYAYYQGGLIGKAEDLSLTQLKNQMVLHVIHASDDITGTLYAGNVMGYGENITVESIYSEGELIDLDTSYGSDTRYLGGIYGYLTGHIELIDHYHTGVISYQPTSQIMNVSGIASLEEGILSAQKITHDGLITMDIQLLSVDETMRYEQSLKVTQGIQTREVTSDIEGLFNTSNIAIDLSYVDQFAQLYIHEGLESASLFHVDNQGDMSIMTSQTLTQNQIFISSIVLGEHVSLSHIRNEGHIDVTITQTDSSLYPTTDIYVSGIASHLSDDQEMKDLYQGGDITVEKNGLFTFDPNVHLAGILLFHHNISFHTLRQIDPSSIDFESVAGPLHNVLQAGNLSIIGSFSGNLDVAGMIYHQKGMTTQAINLGDISIKNYDEQTTKTASGSGITNYLIGKYASIFDSVNQGDVKVSQMSSSGFAHAAGITNRNDLTESHVIADPMDQHHLAKIAFTMNDGNIYAWSESLETSYTISQETKTKAAGILTSGILSVINSVNYGDIYSKYLSAGMIGFLPLNHFGTLQPDEVFIANLIQYGRVRTISSYDWVESSYAIDTESIPTRTVYNAYGAMVGKIHTATSTWAFAGDVTYPIDRIYFGYLINFDPLVSMFANAPELSSSWADGFGNLQEANDVILNMLAYMGTTNPNDQSKAPFTYFFQGGWIGQYMGKVIDYYTISETEGGIFNESYAFRTSRPVYKGTDQYIHDYIQYIDQDHVNPERLTLLESKYGQTFPGIYAISSSKGIGQGIFMPDNIDITSLHPYDEANETLDLTWLGDPESDTSISHKLYVDMRQIYASFAATIYDLNIVQMNEQGQKVTNGLTLTSPVIDQTRKLITYYLPSNAEILNQTTSTLMDVYRFIEVSDGLGHKVPDVVTSGEQTYSWVGDYKKVDDDFVEIGPYHTSGTVMLSTPDTVPYDSYSRNTPVYTQTSMSGDSTLSSIFKHTTHTYILFFWYASGYRVTPQAGYQLGYGAYEAYSLSGYPTLYRYVGPNQEPVTYIQTDVESGVTVFNDANIYFGVDVLDDAHEISSGATLSYDGNHETTLASVPRSYGVYEAMYDAEGHYIDSVHDHYGSVRIYAMSYDPLDPATYQDYEIRIIRTADQMVTDMTSLTVDELNALPAIYDFNHVTSTLAINPLERYQTSSLCVTYETYNVAHLQMMTTCVKLKNSSTGELIDPAFYELKQGYVETLSSFDNATGSWGYGSVTFELIIPEQLPSGTYVLETVLMTGDVYDVIFEKTPSNIAKVTEMIYRGEVIETTDDTYTSTIPYGVFYDSNISETNLVNFTNLSTYLDIDYLSVENNYPSYLDGLNLSMFSYVSSIELDISMLDTIRHSYTITYHLEAEDGTLTTFTHVLNEAMPQTAPDALYKNGSQLPYQVIQIGYNEAPTIRLAYDFSMTFIHTTSPLSVSQSFIPFGEYPNAILGEDYVIHMLPELGYDVDYLKETPIGTYETTLHYDQFVSLWGYDLTWSFTYDTITYQKLLNDQSLLQDIYFVSDAIFQGFNTIIDYQAISIERYEYLLTHPEERPIVQLPTTGILYQGSDDYETYYVIGQVQQTQLSYYAPTMILPDGAIIKRVIDDLHIEPMYQSDDLYDDYSPMSSDFQMIHYRIYAMDYEVNPTHYTDYYVAVQDMTNMIRFDVTIENLATIPLDDIYLKISICQNSEDPLACNIDDEILTMGMFSYLVEGSYQHHVLQTTTFGAYKVDVTLPYGYRYTIAISEVVIIGNAFYVENSIFPRKVYMTLTIEDDNTIKPWGNEDQIIIQP